MANNPYINKVQYGNNTLIDLTADTVTADKILQGYTAHDKSGAGIVGSYVPVIPTDITPSNSSPVSLVANGIYKPSGSGYAIKSYTTKTPSDSNPPSVSSGSFIKPTANGYLYETQQTGATLKTLIIDNNGSVFNSLNQAPYIDVKELLPNDYTNLTLNNFSLSEATPMNGTSTPSGGQTDLFGSYDPTTGILSMNKRYASQKIGSTTYYKYIQYKIKVSYV